MPSLPFMRGSCSTCGSIESHPDMTNNIGLEQLHVVDEEQNSETASHAFMKIHDRLARHEERLDSLMYEQEKSIIKALENALDRKLANNLPTPPAMQSSGIQALPRPPQSPQEDLFRTVEAKENQRRVTLSMTPEEVADSDTRKFAPALQVQDSANDAHHKSSFTSEPSIDSSITPFGFDASTASTTSASYRSALKKKSNLKTTASSSASASKIVMPRGATIPVRSQKEVKGRTAATSRQTREMVVGDIGYSDSKNMSMWEKMKNAKKKVKRKASQMNPFSKDTSKPRASQIEKNKDGTKALSAKNIEHALNDKITEEDDEIVTWRDKISALLHSTFFEVFIISCILINSGFIGLQINFTAQNGRDAPMPKYLNVCELIFCCIFTVELVLRVLSDGVTFIWGPNWKFHLLDTVIVVSAWVEQVMLLTASNSSSQNLAAFSALRIIRLIRVARSVRLMEFSRDLRALVYGMLYCMKPLFWAILLLTLIMFMFCVVLMEFTLDEFTYDLEAIANQTMPTGTTAAATFEAQPSSSADKSQQSSGGLDGDTMPHFGKAHELQWYFGNLSRGMLTLFKAISGGQNWGEVAEPLKHISWFLMMLFCVYIGVVVFAVLNIVMSIFIENARKNTLRDKNNLIWEEIQERNWRTDSLRTMFHKADSRNSGFLNELDFQEYFEDPIIQAFFRTLGLDFETYDMKTLFDIFDYDRKGRVDVENFIACCIHFQGPSTALDMHLLRREQESISQRLMALEGQNGGGFDESERLSMLSLDVPAPYPAEHSRVSWESKVSFQETPES